MGTPIQPNNLQFTTREFYLAGTQDSSAGQVLTFEQLDTTLLFLSNSIANAGGGQSFVGLTTASVNLNTINFSKSNGTTFSITVDTGSGQTYTAGNGININGSNVVSAKLGQGLSFNGTNIDADVRTVNLQTPTNGNISLSITNTITGPSSSLSGSPYFLPDTYSPRPPISGTIFVVSGDIDPDKNGNAYIFVTSSTQAGSWQQIFGFNQTTADLRYVRLYSTTTQNISSSLIISGSTTFSGSLFLSGASDLAGAANNVLVLGTDGKIYKTGSYGSGGGGTPGIPVNSIQFNNASAFGGSSNFTFDGTNTVNLTGSLILSGSAPLRVIGGTSRITGSLIVSNSLSVIGTGSISGSLTISSSIAGQKVLQITGTGSLTSDPLVQITGQNGGFVQIYDSNSGSLFSVNSNTGNAVIDVRSNGQTLIGSNTFQGMYDSTANIAFSSPSQILTTPGYLTSSYNALWFDYFVFSGSYGRSGTLYSIWSGSSISYNDITGSNFGTVPASNITLVTRFSSSFVQITASAATNNWVIKGMVRCI